MQSAIPNETKPDRLVTLPCKTKKRYAGITKETAYRLASNVGVKQRWFSLGIL